MYEEPYELGAAADGYPVRIRARGRLVLTTPMLNRGTAFTPEQARIVVLDYRRSLLDPNELVSDGWEQHAEILGRLVEVRFLDRTVILAAQAFSAILPLFILPARRVGDLAARVDEASALLHVMAEDTQGLESALERIRATEGVTRTVTEVVLSTLFQR